MRISIFISIFFVFATTAFAGDSIRCDGNLVSVGDSIADLISKCPRPMYKHDSKKRETYWVGDVLHSKTVSITKFLYSNGPGEFIREVIVADGVVVEINTTDSKAND